MAGLGRTNNDLEQFFGAWRWRKLRAELEARQAGHRQRWAFRHDPQHYLAKLQDQLVKLVLPS